MAQKEVRRQKIHQKGKEIKDRMYVITLDKIMVPNLQSLPPFTNLQWKMTAFFLLFFVSQTEFFFITLGGRPCRSSSSFTEKSAPAKIQPTQTHNLSTYNISMQISCVSKQGQK